MTKEKAVQLIDDYLTSEFVCTEWVECLTLCKNILLRKDKIMNLTELSKDIHQNAVEHGWWEEERSLAEIIALCHSELSEALEEYRDRKPDLYFVDDKPEGIAVELADCIIRILDYCGKENIDIDNMLSIKHEYNKTRPYRHGGKAL